MHSREEGGGKEGGGREGGGKEGGGREEGGKEGGGKEGGGKEGGGKEGGGKEGGGKEGGGKEGGGKEGGGKEGGGKEDTCGACCTFNYIAIRSSKTVSHSCAWVFQLAYAMFYLQLNVHKQISNDINSQAILQVQLGCVCTGNNFARPISDSFCCGITSGDLPRITSLTQTLRA